MADVYAQARAGLRGTGASRQTPSTTKTTPSASRQTSSTTKTTPSASRQTSSTTKTTPSASRQTQSVAKKQSTQKASSKQKSSVSYKLPYPLYADFYIDYKLYRHGEVKIKNHGIDTIVCRLIFLIFLILQVSIALYSIVNIRDIFVKGNTDFGAYWASKKGTNYKKYLVSLLFNTQSGEIDDDWSNNKVMNLFIYGFGTLLVFIIWWGYWPLAFFIIIPAMMCEIFLYVYYHKEDEIVKPVYEKNKHYINCFANPASIFFLVLFYIVVYIAIIYYRQIFITAREKLQN